MKHFTMIVLLLSSASAQAAVQKITCQLQWKNTNARVETFYIVAKDLGTSKAQLLSKNPVDDWKQYVFGLKSPKGDHIANVGFYEMAIGQNGSPGSDAETGFSKAGDLIVSLDDGVSSQIDILLYKSAGYRAGYIKQHCDPSYCGDFDYYSVLKCKLTPVAGI